MSNNLFVCLSVRFVLFVLLLQRSKTQTSKCLTIVCAVAVHWLKSQMIGQTICNSNEAEANLRVKKTGAAFIWFALLAQRLLCFPAVLCFFLSGRFCFYRLSVPHRSCFVVWLIGWLCWLLDWYCHKQQLHITHPPANSTTTTTRLFLLRPLPSTQQPLAEKVRS